jgi:uncharacterized protein (TIGR02246 family)
VLLAGGAMGAAAITFSPGTFPLPASAPPLPPTAFPTAYPTATSTTLPPTAPPTPTPTTTPSEPAPPTEADIKKLFDDWNTALGTLDPAKVADLYAPDAILLPTVSDKVRKTRADIIDYFKHFLELKPKGEIKERTIKIIGNNVAIDTGIYEFTITENGETKKVKARYTFVYEFKDGKWKIVNHHSSKMPEGGR